MMRFIFYCYLATLASQHTTSCDVPNKLDLDPVRKVIADGDRYELGVTARSIMYPGDVQVLKVMGESVPGAMDTETLHFRFQRVGGKRSLGECVFLRDLKGDGFRIVQTPRDLGGILHIDDAAEALLYVRFFSGGVSTLNMFPDHPFVEARRYPEGTRVSLDDLALRAKCLEKHLGPLDAETWSHGRRFYVRRVLIEYRWKDAWVPLAAHVAVEVLTPDGYYQRYFVRTVSFETLRQECDQSGTVEQVLPSSASAECDVLFHVD